MRLKNKKLNPIGFSILLRVEQIIHSAEKILEEENE